MPWTVSRRTVVQRHLLTERSVDLADDSSEDADDY